MHKYGMFQSSNYEASGHQALFQGCFNHTASEPTPVNICLSLCHLWVCAQLPGTSHLSCSASAEQRLLLRLMAEIWVNCLLADLLPHGYNTEAKHKSLHPSSFKLSKNMWSCKTYILNQFSSKLY